MERNIRYQLLPNDESDAADAVSVEIVAVLPPPDYEEATVTLDPGDVEDQTTVDAGAYAGPPSYKVATELPTYDEAERSKQEEAAAGERPSPQVHPQRPPSHPEQICDTYTGITLGTDCIFLCTFIISFLFNWVGFFISLCLSNTVAGRCGALSGLGLSIVKWAAILQHSEWMSEYVSESDNWIWWMLMFCGFVVFFRGCIQYFQIKYEWKKLTGEVLTLRWFN